MNWVWDEVSVALDRAHKCCDYPVIPILAAHARFEELPSFLSLNQGVSDVEHDADAFTALLRGLVGLAPRTAVQAEAEPFQGLAAFTAQRSHLFFGREHESEDLLNLLRNEPLVMVAGASGSGKSSLVKAGLVPRYRGAGLDDPARPTGDTLWRVIESRPLGDPFETFARAVLSDAQANGRTMQECTELADLVRSRKPSTVRDALQLSAPLGVRTNTLIVLDQFEELFTLSAAGDQADFADLIVKLADAPEGSIRIVLTMRWDYYHLCSGTPDLYSRLERHDRRARYNLRGMSRDNLARCVSEPLRLAGVAPGEREALAAAVLKDVGERPNDLALLEMALQQAWIKRKLHGNDLLRAYVAIGRVDGALATAADDIVTSKLTVTEQSLVESLFIRLVKLGDTGGATRRVANRTELDGGRWDLAQKLATEEGGRLVVVAGDHAEIAHEALVTSWPRYVNWLRNDPASGDRRAEDKRHFDALIDASARWAEAGSPTEQLAAVAHGFDLERYERLGDRRASWLCQRELDFIESSVGERNRVRVRESAAARALKRGAYIAVVLGAMAIVLGATAVWFSTEARRQASAARTAAVLQSAASVAEVDPTLATLILSTLSPDEEPEGGVALASRLSSTPVTLVFLAGHRGALWMATFSPDGNRVVTASGDGTARVWRADGTGTAVILTGHSGPVTSATFSPDGTRIVTSSLDRTARIWRADDARELAVFTGHRSAVTNAAFSPDGTRIVTASDDFTARVWRADDARQVVVLAGHSDAVMNAAFSADGTRIVTASADATARVWRADDARELAVLTGHSKAIANAVFSPDGTRIVTASADATARVWRADDAHEIAVLTGHSEALTSAAFSPDGTRIAVASGDHTARIWRADGTGLPVVLTGHSGPLTSATFSPDGTRIVTTSADRTARVWRVDGMARRPVVLSGHSGPLTSAAFSPDGTRIVTASDEPTARVWRAVDTIEPVVLTGHSDHVWTAAFSPDGTRIVTASGDHTARIWRADGTGTPVVLTGHSGALASAAFSPDGTRIVTASYDGTARVWRADGAGTAVILTGHSGRVTSANFSPDGTRIATASDDRTARVWRADDASQFVVLAGHSGEVTSAKFSPDGSRIVTTSHDRTARIWRADSTGEAVVLTGHRNAVSTAAFSPDGTLLVTAGDDRIARVWRADGTGTAVILAGHSGELTSAAFSPDGTRIVTASLDRTARVWRADGTGTPVVLSRHSDAVGPAAFSPDGTRIVTVSSGTARVWRANGSGTPLVDTDHSDFVRDAVFSPDNTRIVTTSFHTARVWRITWPSLLEALRIASKGCPTAEEYRQYLGDTEEMAESRRLECERLNGR